MKVAICGSMAFIHRMEQVADEISRTGHAALLPEPADTIDPAESREEAARRKSQHDLIRKHWQKIRESDAILVLNYDKNGIAGYIGANTFLEIGFAHVLRKQIYLLHPIPDLPCAVEIKAMAPVVLSGNISGIPQ